MATAAPERGSMLGQGVYSLDELRRYVALGGTPDDARQVTYWLGSVLNPVRRHPRRPDHSFSDLVSVFVVTELRRRGVSAATIRKAETWLRKKWETDRPFVSNEIQTDGRGIYVDDELIAGQIESADRQGQQVMRELVKDRLTHLHYADGTAAYWTPMAAILVDPRVQFGEPVIDGTRVPTAVLADAVRHFGIEAAANRLDVPADAARSAVAFEEKLAALDV